MSKYLVVVESPKKTGSVKKYLGKDFEVVASVGHIADLPEKGLNIDINDDFKPTYKVSSDKKAVVKAIKDKAIKAEVVYLMTDGDREGSYIAYHVANQLPEGTVIKRAITGSITKDGVEKAIANAFDMEEEQHLVNAAEARRLLDRITGYKASFPVKQATGGRSAGRVQSAGLRVLAEREKEIQAFIPQEYWPIEVTLRRENGETVVANIKKPDKLKITNEDEANKIVEAIKQDEWKVAKYSTKERSTRAQQPFTTSSLYMSSSSFLNWNSKKTASMAQQLYEEGSVTYIRSDSTFIVPEVIAEMRTSIPSKYGAEYLPSSQNVFSNKKNAQEAHEAIRVTDIGSESLHTGDKAKLYSMIWKRTVASQMAKMRQFVGGAEFDCGEYVFSSSGSRVIFDGWKKCWDYGSMTDSVLPEFVEGEVLALVSVHTEQKFTTPPNRYSEASFIKKLEERGIGRPSTYKSIIETLKDREYVTVEGKAFHVTNTGLRVVDFLIDCDFCFANLDFTKDLEEDLDSIAENKKSKLEVLSCFWSRLQNDIDGAKKKREDDSKTEFKCVKCGGFLVKKHSQYGPFLSCEHRNNKEKRCDYKCQIDSDGNPYEKPKEVLVDSTFECHNCGELLVKRKSKKNWEYLACRSWQNDDCKGFYDFSTGEKVVFKKKTWGKKKWKKKKE